MTTSLLDILEPVFDDAFAGFDRIALAVSGGPDSMALMHLAATWHDLRRDSGQPVPVLSVVTVDHRLRPDSAAEAATVAQAAATLGLAHTTLCWNGEKPGTGVQDAARKARYGLIAGHLRTTGCGAVAMAHTLDDQAETVLMRLARGSGIDGLGAMRGRRLHDDTLMVLRPLLGIRKSDCIAYLASKGVAFATDPSNDAPAFERVRVRRQLAASGLDPAALSLSARRARRAADALDHLTARIWRDGGAAATFHDTGHAVVNKSWLAAQPEDVRLRIVGALIEAIGGAGEAPALGALERHTIEAHWTCDAFTLGGAAVATTARGQNWLVHRELPRRDEARSRPVQPGQPLLWDRRFEIHTPIGFPPDAVVAPVGADAASVRAWADAQARRHPARPGQRLPAVVVATLPGVFRGSDLLAVPPLGYVAPAAPIAVSGVTCRVVRPHFAAPG